MHLSRLQRGARYLRRHHNEEIDKTLSGCNPVAHFASLEKAADNFNFGETKHEM